MPPKFSPHPRPFRRIPLTPAENKTRKAIRRYRRAEEELKRFEEKEAERRQKEAELRQKMVDLDAKIGIVPEQLAAIQGQLAQARAELAQSLSALKVYGRVAVTNPKEISAVGDVLLGGGWNLAHVSIKADPLKHEDLEEMIEEAEDWAREENASAPDYNVD